MTCSSKNSVAVKLALVAVLIAAAVGCDRPATEASVATPSRTEGGDTSAWATTAGIMSWQTYPDTFTDPLDTIIVRANALFNANQDSAAIRLGSMCAWKCLMMSPADTARAFGMMNRTVLRMLNTGRNDLAFAHLREMEGICDLLPWWKARGERRGLTSLGFIYSTVGDLDKALSCIRMAYEASLHSADPIDRRKASMTLCITLKEAGAFEEAKETALEHWRLCSDEIQRRSKSDPMLLYESADQLGQCYAYLGRTDSSMHWFNVGLHNSELAFGRNSYEHGTDLINKGRACVGVLPPDSIISNCRAGLTCIPKDHPGYRSSYENYAAPALMYAYASKCDEHGVMQYVTVDTSGPAIDWKNIGDPSGLMSRISYAASSFQALYICTGKTSYGSLATRMHEELRKGAMMNMDELDAVGMVRALNDNHKQNSEYLDLLGSLHDHEGVPLAKLAEVMDERRGLDLRRFQQLCAATDPRSRAAARELQELRAERISREKDPSFDQSERDRLDGAIDSLRSFIKRSSITITPGFAANALEQAQAYARKGTSVLTYALSDTTLHILGVYPDTVFFVSRGLAQDDNRMLASIADSIRNSNSSFDPTSTLSRASALLLGSLPPFHGSSLLVIPEGPLARLPFEALPVPGSEKEHLLLGDMIAVRYEYTLSGAPSPSSGASKGELLAVAPEFEAMDTRGIDTARSLDDLQLVHRDAVVPLLHNGEEADGLLALFSGKRLTGRSIQVSDLELEKASASDVLHFATHALCDPEHPERSAIVLSSAALRSGHERSTIEHNASLIREYEIQGTSIHANMAVLSACETGVGRELMGEGALSIARAFRFAGVPNVVSSLWKVDDLATKEIMVKFYEHLAEGMGKADALAEAKRWYRRTNPNEPPSKWAAFILIGDNEPVHLKKRSPVKPWMVGGAIAAVIAAVVLARRRRRMAA